MICLPPPALENAPPGPPDKEPPASGRGGASNNSLHPRAIKDAHDQIPSCVPCPHPPAPVPDGQHLLRPEEESKGQTPRGVGLPFPDPRVLPAPSRTRPEALYGLGQVCRRQDSSDESREELPGRPPNLEVP